MKEIYESIKKFNVTKEQAIIGWELMKCFYLQFKREPTSIEYSILVEIVMKEYEKLIK